MSADFKIKMLLLFGFSRSQIVQVFYLDELRLDYVEFKVEVLRLLSRHSKAPIKLI